MRTRPALEALLIALILSTLATAQIAAADETRTIVVSGNGEAAGNADTADLSFAIETHAKTAADAAARNAALAQKITDSLKAKLGDKGRIWTGGYSLSPDYEQHQGRENPAIVGYNAQNSINVETPAMNLLGDLIDTAISAGANRVNYLNFTLKNDAKARAEALENASRDAQAQAQTLASSLKVRLKRLITASTQGVPRPVPLRRMEAAFATTAGAVSTPIEAGQITVSATVYLTYEIE